MKGVLVVVLTCCFLMQPYDRAVAVENEDEMDYAWGTVKEVSNDTIVLTEYSYDTDVDIDVAYGVSPDTEIFNVESLDNIKIGDAVEIEYIVASGKKEAMIISVEMGEEEYVPIGPPATFEEDFEYTPEDEGIDY